MGRKNKRKNDFEDRFISALDKKLNNPVDYTSRMKKEEDEFYEALDEYYHLLDLKCEKKISDSKVYSV